MASSGSSRNSWNHVNVIVVAIVLLNAVTAIIVLYKLKCQIKTSDRGTVAVIQLYGVLNVIVPVKIQRSVLQLYLFCLFVCLSCL